MIRLPTVYRVGCVRKRMRWVFIAPFVLSSLWVGPVLYRRTNQPCFVGFDTSSSSSLDGKHYKLSLIDRRRLSYMFLLVSGQESGRVCVLSDCRMWSGGHSGLLIALEIADIISDLLDRFWDPIERSRCTRRA